MNLTQTVPLRIATPAEALTWAERGDAALYLIQRDGDPAPYLAWPDDSGDWHGVRGVTEEDGPWQDLSTGTRATLGVPLSGFDPVGDEEYFIPFTVLWHDALHSANFQDDYVQTPPAPSRCEAQYPTPKCGGHGPDHRCVHVADHSGSHRDTYRNTWE